MDFGDAWKFVTSIGGTVGTVLLFGPIVLAGIHAAIHPEDSHAQDQIASAGANAIASVVLDPFQLLIWAGAIAGLIGAALVCVWLWQNRE